MNKFNEKLIQFFSSVFFGSENQRSYKRLRIMLYLSMIIIFLTPLVFATGLSTVEYSKLLVQEEREQLSWNATGSQKTIEAFVHELRALVAFVASVYTYDELLDQGAASKLFVHLKEHYKGFVDLGVIDPDGIQRVYAGPFRLQGYDYSDQDWYDKVLGDQVYISDVFMGFRKIPHFVVAVSNKMPGREESWILRLSINYATLQQYIATISTEASHDVFLLNHKGILQTQSHMFGDVLEEFALFSRPKTGEICMKEQSYEYVKFLETCVYIENTPWILGLIKKSYIHGEKWKSFRYHQRMILFGCSVVALMVILQTVSIITKRLQAADEKRNAAMSECEHTNKLASIGRLAAGVAHEINNPLAIIDQKAGLMTDLLEMSDEFQYKDKFGKSIEGIQNAVERCKVITHRLLGFARRMDAALEHIDINALLREVLGFLEREALYNHIVFELSFDDNLPTVYSDRGQLQQIFLNIINNGIDAIGKDGTMRITSTCWDENNIHVLIEDTGKGMPAKVINRIFDPFFSTKKEGKGTGLGLSITYGLVKKLGGNITVESEEGKGTLFTVILPKSPEKREGSFHG